MTYSADLNSTRKQSSAARWSFKLALLGVVLLVLAVIGHRLGIMDFRIAMFGLVGGVALGLVAVFAGVIGIIVTRKETISGKPFAWVGLMLGLLVTSPVFMTIYGASNVPPIHDISTDLQDPPEFVAILALRTANHNSLDRDVPTNLTTLQQDAYPGLVPLLINKEPRQVFEEALALVETLGWEVVATVAEEGRIEATATTPMMGFKDDVVIRVRDQAGQSIVDMRSVSRVGKSDLGANAKRIELFLAELQD